MDPPQLSKCFKLNVKDTAFTARQVSIFGNLPVVELTSKKDESHTSSIPPDVETEEENEEVIVASYKGEESIFKRPMPKLKRPSHRPRKQSYPNRMVVPDHKKNPQKWVKYSLASTSDVTDKSNSAAAFSFLREIEERKRKSEAPDDDSDDVAGKIIFKKPRNKEDDSQGAKTFRDRKLLMPTFEFGAKKPSKSGKKIKPTPVKNPQTQERSLQHLMEEENDAANV